jgi:hypothetical protein
LSQCCYCLLKKIEIQTNKKKNMDKGTKSARKKNEGLK